MVKPHLRFIVRTPHEVILDTEVLSARVLTETGHVGIRPRMEAVVLAVESGSVVLDTGQGILFAASAGGLLMSDGAAATLLTPLAVVGRDVAAVEADLERALTIPDAEQTIRAMLDKLEGRILAELRRQPLTQRIAPGVRHE